MASIIRKFLLSIILTFPILATSAPLISINATTPFPANVGINSTTNATYTIANTSPITLLGIQDQSTLASGIQVLGSSTCSSSTPLAPNASCQINLRLTAPSTSATLTSFLRERALPSLYGAQLSITTRVISDQYTVTPSGDGNVTIDPATAQTVTYGSTQAFDVTANDGYTLNNAVGGTCPAGSWEGGTYTTGVITQSCSVSFSATANPTVTSVMPSSGNTAGGQTVLIQGTNFTDAATVKFGTTSATVVSTSSTALTVTAPAHAAGFNDVTVTVSSATSATSNADLYAYGSQYLYVSYSDGFLTHRVYYCTPSSTTGLTNDSCNNATAIATLGGNSPEKISITSIGTRQYAYVIVDTGGGKSIYTCLIRNISPAFQSCIQAYTAPAAFTLNGMAFATIGGTQYAYLVGHDGNAGEGIAYRCTINSSTGVLTCGASHTTGTPPWEAPPGNLQSIIFQPVNNRLYAYLAYNNGGNAGANIYYCQMTSSGYFDIDSCTAGSAVPTTSSPAQMVSASMGGSLYNYFGQTNAQTVRNCVISSTGDSTGDLSTCYVSGATAISANDMQIATFTGGTALGYLEDNALDNLYYCPFNDAANNYTLNNAGCQAITTNNGIDFSNSVAGGGLGFIVSG